MAYDKNKDYQAEIEKAVEIGDYYSASQYEQQRNEKIDKEGLNYEKTYNYTVPKGVSAKNYNQANTKFSTSSEHESLNAETKNAATNYKNLISKEDIISDSTKNAINQKFKTPSAVTEADAYLSSQLQKIQSGKTSYSDQVQAMMDKIMNREKFSYDVDTDPLFQQALASAMNSGKQAMQDTIGQASALTGGYGSTYATSAGNQAYNAYIEDAYDNLPQYYQMALNAYQMEGEEMYRQFGMVSELDNKEYNRNVAAYDATYQHRNQLYNEAYGMFRDTKNDAFNMANLELNEYGQRVNDAYNYYNIASDQEKTQYEREYAQWSDSVNQAYQMMGMENSDWWNQTNYDEGVRQYEKTFAEQQRQYNESLAEQKRQHNEQMAYKYAALKKSGSGGGGGSGSKKTGTNSPTSQQLKGAKDAFNNLGFAGYLDFIEELPSDVNIGELDALVGADSNLGMYYNTYTKKKDAFWHIPGGVDNNDTVTDQDGKSIKVKNLPKDLQKQISNAPEGTEFEWDEKERKWVKVQSGGGSR